MGNTKNLLDSLDRYEMFKGFFSEAERLKKMSITQCKSPDMETAQMRKIDIYISPLDPRSTQGKNWSSWSHKNNTVSSYHLRRESGTVNQEACLEHFLISPSLSFPICLSVSLQKKWPECLLPTGIKRRMGEKLSIHS